MNKSGFAVNLSVFFIFYSATIYFILPHFLCYVKLKGSLNALHSFYSLKNLIIFYINKNLYCLSSSKRERLLGLDDHSSHLS